MLRHHSLLCRPLMFRRYLAPYQALDEMLQFLLSLPHCFFSANHSDELLVFVLCGGEDDPRPGAVTNLTDVPTTFPDQELVVFWFSTQLGRVTLSLLKKNNVHSTLRRFTLISRTWRIIFLKQTRVVMFEAKKQLLTQTFSSARARSCCLAFSTSSTGPRMVTLSIPEPSVGKWMCTPPHSSMMERTKRPFDPINEL